MGIFNASTTDHFLKAIEDLKSRGAECVILGCTEIPLIVSPENSALPTFDSTRLLAKYAVREAISDRSLPKSGWLPVV
jgi:aspartate racemase